MGLLATVVSQTVTAKESKRLEQKPTVSKHRQMVSLTQRDGLAGETVYRVMTDHLGYKWIATTGGVNVFNGRDLMTLRVEDEREHALDVRDLCEGADHTVYAATLKGLYRLTGWDYRFERILPEIRHPLTLLTVGDTLYVGSEQGLHIYDGQQLKHIDIGISHKGLDNIVRHFQCASDGSVWFLSRFELCRYNPHTGGITRHDLRRLIAGRLVPSQFCIVGDKFFVGTRNNGLYSINLAQGEAHAVEGMDGKIVFAVERSDSLVCVSTDGAGAWLIDATAEQVVQHFSMEAAGASRLPTNAVYSFCRDHDGICWIGMVRYGLAYSPHNSRLFQPYRPDGMSTVGMNVRTFLRHGSQTLLGLQNGLWLVDSSRSMRRFFSVDDLGGNIVNCIVRWQGQYYIGLYDGGVRVVDPVTMQLHHQPFSPILRHTVVGDMKVAPDGALWVGCSDGLLMVGRDGSVRHLTEQNSHITGGIIISITFDTDGNGWLTGAKGLSLYSRQTGDVVETQFPDGFFHEEPYMRGQLGRDGMVYMRTGPQLFYTDNQMRHFGEWPMPVRLTDKWCRSMVDGDKRLWLASERGLLGIPHRPVGRGAEYKAADGNVIQLGEGEGLWGDQISEVRMTGDTLWVVTSNGLYFTTQAAIDRWATRKRPHVTLSHVRIGGDLVTPQEMSRMSESKEMRIPWNLTSEPLHVKPLLVDYARHDGRVYEYRVDGGAWKTVEDGSVIDVRHLQPGHHQLTVRQAGAKGTETDWQLTVVPSAAAWTELLLLIAAGVLLWLWYRYRKNTKVLLNERNEIEEALIGVEQKLAEAEEQGYAAEQVKYSKVKIDETECAVIVSRMKEYIEHERVYTNADLKMKDLADVLHLSAPKLSVVFNRYLKENYYDFINRYRLDAFKRLIAAGEHRRLTITALSEQCGFKKSNFFSTFRKVEGMTPAEYLKKRGVKV